MKLSVCIDMMFKHYDIYSRIGAVKKCGFNTVEFWKWSNKDITRFKEELNKNNMQVSIFNLDCKDEKLSYDISRGILNTGRKTELLQAIEESIPVYKELNASGMIVLIGETAEALTYDEQINNVYECLKAAAKTAEENNITLLVEPLNAQDRQNYFLPYSKPLCDIIRRVNSKNVKLLFDIYHQQVTEGNVLKSIYENIDIIGHFHVADCPGRHEPGTGELNYPKIITEINKLDYNGFIGLEYIATKPDEETFDFLKNI